MISRWKQIKLLIVPCLVMVLSVAPITAQDGTGQNEDTDTDTLTVFGDGLNGSSDADYDYDALVKELYGSEESCSRARSRCRRSWKS
mgnify:CR=1 FL=1